MSKATNAGILAFALLLPALMTVTPVTAATQKTGCFFFTTNGVRITPTVCNANANDLRVKFDRISGTDCNIQFTVNGNPDGGHVRCPPGANDVEVSWGLSATGATVITGCTWTHRGVPITASCPIPTTTLANGFEVDAGAIVKVWWTLNGGLLKPAILAPAGANDLEFHLK